MRTIKPKEEQDSESSQDPNKVPEATSSSNKRRCISSACLPCRKRKSKCDGATPFCSTCTAVYHTECTYDVDSDHRRKAALKRDIQALKEENGALGVIIASIKTSSDSEVNDIVQQIRADEDYESIAASLKKDVTLTESPGINGAEDQLSHMLGRPSTDESGVLRHYGHTSNLGWVNEIRPTRDTKVSEEWTTVTRDRQLMEHLLDLYFCWSHPYYALFSREAFTADMNSGRSKYCSPLLVNAILALACHYSDRSDLRSDPADPSTAGNYFFEEAKRLLYENETSSLTTVQALAVMGLREPSCGRDSSGFAYAGRAVRMAIELGLHLTFEANSHKLGPTELEVRKITFWGLFTSETAWGLCIGRPTQLPTSAINLERPKVLDRLDLHKWTPYSDYGPDGIPGADQPGYTYTLQDQFIQLSEIVNDTVFMFYAPRERFTSRKLLEFYKRYTQWYEKLPTSLHLRDVTLPHVLALHMYYNAVIIHLFRAFLKLDLVRSDLSPRTVCTTSANTIADLLSTYRSTYGFRNCSIVISHVVLTANIIDLINLPSPMAAQNLELGVTVMREGSANHAFFERCLNILLKLSKQWETELPASTLQAAYDTRNDIPHNHPMRTSSTASHWSPTLSSTNTYSQNPPRTSAPEIPFYATTKPSKPQTPMGEFFWSPFPDQNLPLQAMSSQNGPMDIAAMVEQQGVWDRIGRDGFKMASVEGIGYGVPTYVSNGQGPGGWEDGCQV